VAAVLVLGAAGCCGLTRGDSAALDRDTPERAFDFVRAAFAGDRTGDQYDSFHPDFCETQGLSAGRYAMARSLRPGLFERASVLLGGATLESVAPAGLRDTAAGRRRATRVVILTADGGRGEFLLVDEPAWRMASNDGELPVQAGRIADLEEAVRLVDGSLVVGFRAPLGIPPLEGTRIHRVTLHHDWLLYGIERLEGFEEFLEDVGAAADEAGRESE